MSNDDLSLPEKFRRALSRYWHSLWVLAKHPVTGVAVAIGVGLITYLLTRTVKEPVFAVSPTELVAQTVQGEQRLRILWDNNEVPSVASVKIAIWNDGSSFIDKSDFASNNPLRIRAGESVRVLAVRVLKTSRRDLEFDARVTPDSDGTETVGIEIKGDEALEKHDGALFHVLFSGGQDVRWNVVARIKGVPLGFRQKDWAKVYRSTPIQKAWLDIASALLLISMTVAFFLLESHNAKRRGRAVDRRALLLVSSVALVGLFLTGLKYSYLLGPKWLGP